MKKKLFPLIMVFAAAGLVLAAILTISTPAASQDLPPVNPEEAIEIISPYFAVTRDRLKTGEEIIGTRISGPPDPLPGYENEGLISETAITGRGIISSFPSYDWVFGCSAVSSAMQAAYYDNNGFPNMYTGPTNGGVMPLTDTSWTTWYSSVPDDHDPYPNNPLVASHSGVDGHTGRGSIDDYWLTMDSSADDPYITNGWVEHTWGSAVGDYLKTSQSAYYSNDGGTWFFNNNSNSKLTCAAMESSYYSPWGMYIDEVDGTYGRKLFYESKGYSVGDCYNQATDNKYTGGFSLADFQAEIDAGHPVLVNVEGHSMVGYGYSGSTIYIRNTWDSNTSNTYTMTWGGSYQGMDLYAVSVVHPIAGSPPSPPASVDATDGMFTDRVVVSWPSVSGATYYKVFRNAANTHVGEVELTSSIGGSPYWDNGTAPGDVNYYWVQACNASGCSTYSSPDTGYRASIVTHYDAYLPLIIKGVGGASPLLNGDFEQGQVGWDEYSLNGWDLIGNFGVAHGGDWSAWLGGDYNEISEVYQTVSISPAAPYLHYWYYIYSEDVCGFDYFKLYLDSSTPVIQDLCDASSTGDWVEGVVDLSGFAGSSWELKFQVTTDSSLNSNFWLDDVSFSSSSSASAGVFLQERMDMYGIMKADLE